MNTWIALMALAAFGVGLWSTFYRTPPTAAGGASRYVVQTHLMAVDEHGPDRRVHSYDQITVPQLERARRLARRLRQDPRADPPGRYAVVTVSDEHGTVVWLDG